MALPNPRYNYTQITARDLIDQAFLYVGVSPAEIDQLKTKAAIFALNEILSSWINKGVLQFNETIIPVKLQNNVASYTLSDNIYDVYDVTKGSLGRRRNGNAYSTAGGTPANAFDNNFSTACIQTSPNGSLGIEFLDAENPRVDYVGVLSGSNTDYTLTIEGSDDNQNWIPLLENTRTQPFKAYKNESGIVWYALKSPQPFKYLQIRETGGATLNIVELYFETYINSIYIAGIGRSNYMQISAKMTPATPSLYSMAKYKNNITISLRGVPVNLPTDQDYPGNSYSNNFLLCRGASLSFTVNYLHNPLEVNSRFIGSLRSALSYQLSILYKPEVAEVLRADSIDIFNKALANDSDGGALYFQKTSYKA
jgi:hypothetical protein